MARNLALALLGSLALHASVAVLVVARPAAAVGRGVASERPPTTAFHGDTFEIDALIEAPALPRSAPGAEAPPPAPAAPARAAPPAPPPPAPAPAELATAAPPAPSPPAPASPAAAPVSAPSVASSTGQTGQTGTMGSGPRAAASAYGAEGVGDDPRDLEPALLRALPAAAASRVAGWEALVDRPELVARVTLELGDDGRLAALRVEPGAPAPLAALLQRCRWLLARGRFALPAGAPEPGAATFVVAARVSRREPDPNPFADPGDIMRRGFAPATEEAPARAHFTFASGLHVVLAVVPAEAPGVTSTRARGAPTPLAP